jgi:hypothetical protein
MTTAVANFIEALLAHYPVRYDSEEREDAWVNSITVALRQYPADLLNEVAQDIIRTRKYRNFPLLSEILDKCEAIEARREHIARAQALPEMRKSAGDEWSSERVKFAYDLIKSGMGKQAAGDSPCWILALWHFCRKNQRLPAGKEIDACKREAHEFDEAYDRCLRGEAGPLSRALERLGDSMAAKREKLVAEVLG